MCWKGILKKTGIKNLHWHDLRHDGTSRYALILGKDIFKLKVVSGHADIRSLERYVNHSAEDVAFELAGGTPGAAAASAGRGAVRQNGAISSHRNPIF